MLGCAVRGSEIYRCIERSRGRHGSIKIMMAFLSLIVIDESGTDVYTVIVTLLKSQF